MTVSHIALGNQALRAKDYERALMHYRHAQQAHPQLAHLLEANIALAERRLGKDRSAQPTSGSSAATAIDIVVPVYNALEDVQRCLASLEANTDGFNVRIIVVNDGSDEPTTRWLRMRCTSNPLFTLIEHSVNQGYTKAVNDGLKASTAPYVITQNSDTIVAPGWLKGLVRCIESDPKLGIVGPLSNAASWQNVPLLRDESTGSFAVNELPPGMDVADMAELVAEVSERRYPRLPFVNGFCFMIRRAVIDAIGYMDEENFPVGYGEENDYCIRAMDAGFELAIADDVYVFHAKSKSFGHDRRKELSARGAKVLKLKHGAEKYSNLVESIKRANALEGFRARVKSTLEARSRPCPVDLMSMQVLFLLPVKGGGGGAHSVIQEVAEMRRLGINARVGVKREHVDDFLRLYADIPSAAEIILGFGDDNLLQIAGDCDIVVGTIFSSMKLVKKISDVYSHVLPAYYVQDYEPLFFELGTEKWQEAYDSYTLIPGALLFAKTQWLIEQVQSLHGVPVHKVQPSIDHNVYKPAQRSIEGRLCITAMIRPQTPRRGAGRTMRLLARLYRAFGDEIDIHVFGCDDQDPRFKELAQEFPFPFKNHGVLIRPEVAALLAQSDLFIDLSDYQAFGRTALEAMACGCAAVVPLAGGAGEYARHGENSLVLDSSDEGQCLAEVSRLLSSPGQLRKMRRAGLATAARYSLHAAAVSECLVMEKHLLEWRSVHPRVAKPLLLVMPDRRQDGLPADSAYVRQILPCQSAEVLKRWRVRQVEGLPPRGSADVLLLQRDVKECAPSELRKWIEEWRSAGGRIVYDIDEDLLDASRFSRSASLGEARDLAARARVLVEMADVVHVPCVELAERLRSLNDNVRVIPDTLDPVLWNLDRPRRHDDGPYARRPHGPIQIGYIGEPNGGDGLEFLAEVVKELEKKYGEAIHVEVVGAFQGRSPLFGRRVGLPKKNDYPNFVRWLQQRVHWHLAIALPFNSCQDWRSSLRKLEYAALEIPVVELSIADGRERTQERRCSPADWASRIASLVDDDIARQELVDKAKASLLHNISALKIFADSLCNVC